LEEVFSHSSWKGRGNRGRGKESDKFALAFVLGKSSVRDRGKIFKGGGEEGP